MVSSVILGQLIQTGRRFCECRASDYLPRTDTQHTIVAYTVNDHLLARSVCESEIDVSNDIYLWLRKNNAIAYVLITRNANNNQTELPPPVGRISTNIVTITAATNRAIQQAAFRVKRLQSVSGIKLLPASSSFETTPFARLNYLQANFEREDEPRQESETYPSERLAIA